MQAGGAARRGRSAVLAAEAATPVTVPWQVDRWNRQAATIADGRREARNLPQAGGADDTARR